ncbi:Rho GTPase-activating protein 9 [Coemansia aciculifera]|uniref:Rho GTPase-activating protein 9 n=1 Tax=Coemansia aciculifera TaxID=417176 RepID=A0ACC1LXD1_9FUNG|nr:Rho GTPase-activating protein 9 [Coemansia aciculifera]
MLAYFPADDIDSGAGASSDATASTHHYDRDQDLELAQKIGGMANAVRSLPSPNRNTLAYLLAHLDKVQAFQEFNMMNSENLSIVFGPTILPAGSNAANAALDIRRSAKVVKFLLDNRRAIIDTV